MALESNDECYVHIHVIVCLNMPVLGTNMYLGTVNNVAEGTFHFPFTENSFFYFRMRKLGYFVKQLPKICHKVGALHYLKILGHMYLQITTCIVHKHACWIGERCCRRMFSFSLHIKIIFYFRCAKNRFSL